MGRKWIKSFCIVFMFCFCIVGWSLLAEALAEHQSPEDVPGLIRLHVLANSDSPSDQNLKLSVRDAIIRYLSPLLENIKDPDEARDIILEQKLNLINLASKTLLAQGAYYPVDVEVGVFDFPLKTYGDIVVPAGRYEAVRILIGEAGGANWWCVLFPPLCFIDESKVVRTTDNPEIQSEMQIVSDKIEFRFKIAELIREL